MTGKNLILASVTLISIIVVFAHGPIAQDPAYHNFADQRTLLGLPNGWNILSNALFVAAGAWGLVFVLYLMKRSRVHVLLLEYALFFAGIFLTGIGSSFYHFNPSNTTLIWDRLPMTIAFMALLSSVISECVNKKAGSLLLVPLLALGGISVGYWILSENAGHGDLRLYVLVQFLPVVLIPLILLLYKPSRIYGMYVWALAILYIVAKLFELFDREVYVMLGIVSGHTLKHIIAALGTGCILKMLYHRKIEFIGNRR